VSARGPRLRVTGPELEDLTYRATADALVAITRKLGQFRGESRFTTWAYRFVILEVSDKIGRRFWRNPSVPLDAEDWDKLPDRFGFEPAQEAEWLPALLARGRGALVITSSLAGLTAVPGDPIYAATKHAVVGLARALGPALAADHIAVNALCPGFADTAINEPVRHLISAAGIPLMTADEVADALLAILASDRTGEAWCVQPGRPAEPFAFRNVPGPRAPDGSRIGGVPGMP
jgi:hypothetical protein